MMDAWTRGPTKPQTERETTPWRQTPLAKYVDRRIYDVERGYLPELGKKTKPWFVWNPPDDKHPTEPHEAVQFVNELEGTGSHEETPFLPEWKPFRLEAEHTAFELDFRPSMYYGEAESKKQELLSTVGKFRDQFGIDSGDSIPARSVNDLRSIRDEAKSRLESCGKKLNYRVMGPLRNVLIPCAVEGIRANGGLLTPKHSLGEDIRNKRKRIIRNIDHLWYQIRNGFSFRQLSENTLDECFCHIPEPVSEGAKSAVRVYVESNNVNFQPDTLEDILEEERPVYFKWRAACLMIESALYDWKSGDIAEKAIYTPERKAENVFENISRDEGSNTRNPSRVRQWAVESFEYFYSQGNGAENAKDKVLNIASENNYHFSRKSLERWTKEQRE